MANIVCVHYMSCLVLHCHHGGTQTGETCRPNTPFVQSSPSNKMMEGVRERAGCGATRSLYPKAKQSKAKRERERERERGPLRGWPTGRGVRPQTPTKQASKQASKQARERERERFSSLGKWGTRPLVPLGA